MQYRNSMKKTLRIAAKIMLALLIIFPLIVVLLVRFTDGRISSGETIILSYDEDKGRFLVFEKKVYELEGLDGPYLIGGKLIRVDENNRVFQQPFSGDSVLVRVNNPAADQFHVRLRQKHSIPEWEYEQPERLIAISDIEGNFDGFAGFLQKNGVIDAAFNWVFADGHLALLGDFTDRGANVIPTLWLVYKLEQEAAAQGGMVHYVLGNHEIMNIQGNFRYALPKYKKIAQEIGKHSDAKSNYKMLFAPQSELGTWLRTKNVAEKIGEYVFVHAGLSPEIPDHAAGFAEINSVVRKNIDQGLYNNPGPDEKANFLMGRKGPFWYRGMAMEYKYYDKIKEPEFTRVLSHFGAKKVVIGHTVVDDIETDFDGRLIKIDLKHGREKFTGKTKGILLENDVVYKIDDLGRREML